MPKTEKKAQKKGIFFPRAAGLCNVLLANPLQQEEHRSILAFKSLLRQLSITDKSREGARVLLDLGHCLIQVMYSSIHV